MKKVIKEIFIKDYMVLQKPNLGIICAEPLRNGSPWRGIFEPSTAPFRHERERVLTDNTKIGFPKIQTTY